MSDLKARVAAYCAESKAAADAAAGAALAAAQVPAAIALLDRMIAPS